MPRSRRMAAVAMMMLKTVRMAIKLSNTFWVEMIRTRKLNRGPQHNVLPTLSN